MSRSFGKLSVMIRCCAVGVVFWTGCEEREEIHSYQVVKTSSSADLVQTGSTPGRSTSHEIDWTVPDGWRRLPGDRPMRVATFEAASGKDTVEIAVSAFPGDAGGLLSNVNRWRDQIALEPISEDELVDHLIPFSNNGLHGFALDMAGSMNDNSNEPARRIIGVMIHDGIGSTWFVKALDQPFALNPHKDAILRFAKSFRFTKQAPSHDHNDVHAHPSPSTGSDCCDHWNQPGYWKEDSSTSPIVAKVFDIDHPDGAARVTITPLRGDGGGTLPNVNRWRHQLGLPLIARLEDQTVRHIGSEAGPRATVVDLLSSPLASSPESSSDAVPASPPQASQTQNLPVGRQRMVVAILPLQEETWFFKIVGPQQVVEQETPAFEQLVLSHISHPRHP